MPPLAELLRPQTLADFIGQEDLVGQNGPIRKFIETKNIPSMIFWGPPASGKTSLARIISKDVNSDFIAISAVMEGKEDLKKVLIKAKENQLTNIQTILFIDEIHRWNKAQQDALLPYVENGAIILIGATTENPSFSIISALLSRTRVFVFKPHTVEDICKGLELGIKRLNLDSKLIPENIISKISQISDGDLRFAITTLEIALRLSPNQVLDEKIIDQAAQRSLLYDKNGEEHYNLISALHKSLRSSQATSSVYWLIRMLQAGEDPLYLARRMLRFASEDIGNTNPNALLLANQVFDAVKNLGMPECETALVQLAEFLANSPKNNASYKALNLAKSDVKNHGTLPVPLHLRNAPTKLMKNLDYGKNYQYDHDLPNKKSDQQTMPDKLVNRDYFSSI